MIFVSIFSQLLLQFSIGTVTFVISENRTWYPQYSLGVQKWRGAGLSHDGKYILGSAKNDYLYVSTDYGRSFHASTQAGIKKWSDVTVSASGLDLSLIHI